MAPQYRTIEELSGLLLPNQQVRPIFLLGAGASFNSGVPLASEMVRQIARHALAREKGRSPEMVTDIMEGDIRRFLQRFSWGSGEGLAEMFPHAVEEILTPSTFRRLFFDQMLSRGRKPSVGYQALAKLMQRQLIHTVLTTNFDSLIEDSVRAIAPHSRSIAVLNKIKGDLVNFNPVNSNQIIYLHGAVEFYTDSNTIEETATLNPEIVERLRALVPYSPLVVVGYRGYEPSIMTHLLGDGVKSSHRYKHGVYWCILRGTEVHPKVLEFADKIGTNFSFVEIDGFDELLVQLEKNHSGQSGFKISQTFAQGAVHAIYDKSIREDIKMSDLYADLLLATAKTYAEKVFNLKLQPDELDAFLESNELARRGAGGQLLPSIGLYLLTGKDVASRFPFLKTLLISDDKQQRVFEGNILSQFQQLRTELLSNGINKPIRVKLASGAVEITPYNDRALVELLVNLLAHRDYQIAEPNCIRVISGESVSFTTPGGLPEEVARKLNPDSNGRFIPQMNVYQVRNPVIAEILYSQGVMDKAGSGLSDVAKFTAEHYGQSEFLTGKANESVTVKLRQALSSGDSVGRTAAPLKAPVTYQTNLLPFIALPEVIYSFPLEEKYSKPKRGREKFPAVAESSLFRQVAYRPVDGELWLLADPRNFAEDTSQLGYLEYTRERKLSEVLADEVKRGIAVSLFRKCWEIKLRSVDSQLIIEPKSKRAYFVKLDEDGYTLVYDSAMRKNVQRGVVKKREGAKSTEYENEGIYYSVVQYGGAWAIQIKHFYLFTDSSGRCALSGTLQTRRATRRYKFDRNASVRADLQFWTTYLSGKQPTIDLGMGLIPDVILSAAFLNAEVIES